MAKRLSKYEEAFCARLAAIRKTAGYTQKRFAKLLGLSRDTYAKYETRSLIRHDLIPRISKITGHDTWFILTGQPPQEAIPEYEGGNRRGVGQPGFYYGEERRRRAS